MNRERIAGVHRQKEALRQAEREKHELAIVRRVGRAVTHEINNPASLVIGFGELALNNLTIANDAHAAYLVQQMIDGGRAIAERAVLFDSVWKVHYKDYGIGKEQLLDIRNSANPPSLPSQEVK